MYRTELRGRYYVGCALGVGADWLLDRALLSAPLQPAGGSAPRDRRLSSARVSGSSSNTGSNGFCSRNCTRPHNQGMEISELEFVQIIIMLLVMTLVIVVITCLLSHYWLPALAFLNRLSHTQGDPATQLVVPDHLTSSLPHFMQQQQQQQQQQQLPCRFQPTYPYLRQEIINLPPLICLSDGEELLPYGGICSFQLRPPEQQLELSRAAVLPPPNRTVFDIYLYGKSPRAPSSNTGTDDVSARMEGLPRSYNEVMGDHTCSTASCGQHSSNALPTDERSGCDSSDSVQCK